MNQDQRSKLDETYGLLVLKNEVVHFKSAKKIENIKQNMLAQLAAWLKAGVLKLFKSLPP